MARRKTSTQRLSRQVTELAWAAPQVVAQRGARMASAGPWLSTRDQAEFMRMGSEKVEAFQQSWAGMWMAGWRAWWEMSMSMAQSPMNMPNHATRAAVGVLSAGVAPVHKRAVANARRLGRQRT